MAEHIDRIISEGLFNHEGYFVPDGDRLISTAEARQFVGSGRSAPLSTGNLLAGLSLRAAKAAFPEHDETERLASAWQGMQDVIENAQPPLSEQRQQELLSGAKLYLPEIAGGTE